jgi:hypothetical protein
LVFETESHYVAQAGLSLLSAVVKGITGTQHQAQRVLILFKETFPKGNSVQFREGKREREEIKISAIPAYWYELSLRCM